MPEMIPGRHNPRHGAQPDSPVRAKLVTSEVASKIAAEVAATYHSGETPHVFDGPHEGLGTATKIIAWEGGDAPYGWPADWPTSAEGKAAAEQHGVWFEAVHGCALAVFPLGPKHTWEPTTD
jgi:hypothetical protein